MTAAEANRDDADADADTDADGDAGVDGTPDFLVVERETPRGTLVSVCDADVLGETFEDGDVSLTVTEEFYAGDAADAETVVDSLANAAVANIVGTEAVRVGVDAGLIDEENVLDVDGTRHAQLLWM